MKNLVNEQTTLILATMVITLLCVILWVKVQAKTSFDNCLQAEAAGVYNIKKTNPAYKARLDKDHDGIACEVKR